MKEIKSPLSKYQWLVVAILALTQYELFIRLRETAKQGANDKARVKENQQALAVKTICKTRS